MLALSAVEDILHIILNRTFPTKIVELQSYQNFIIFDWENNKNIYVVGVNASLDYHFHFNIQKIFLLFTSFYEIESYLEI